jgi:hypothetical protein
VYGSHGIALNGNKSKRPTTAVAIASRIVTLCILITCPLGFITILILLTYEYFHL